MLNKKIKLILFDLDGTLLHLKETHEEKRAEVKNFFVQLGIPENWVFKPLLVKINEAILYLKEQGVSKEEAFKIKKQVIDLLDKKELEAVEESRVIKDSKIVINQLKSKGMKVGIFSVTGKKTVMKSIELTGLGPFDVIVSREDVANVKPDPEGIIVASKKLKIPLENTVLVGDNVTDIKAGKSAGCFSIGVLSGVSTREMMEEVGADLIIQDISELVGIL